MPRLPEDVQDGIPSHGPVQGLPGEAPQEVVGQDGQSERSIDDEEGQDQAGDGGIRGPTSSSPSGEGCPEAGRLPQDQGVEGRQLEEAAPLREGVDSDLRGGCLEANPHIGRMRDLYQANIDGARRQMVGADDYARKQLQAYVRGMQRGLEGLEDFVARGRR
jgi:hypothetical protein